MRSPSWPDAPRQLRQANRSNPPAVIRSTRQLRPPSPLRLKPRQNPLEPQQPAAGKADTLVYATNISDRITLDPAQMYAWTGILTVNKLYQGLVMFEGIDFSAVKPALAEKWDIAETANGWKLTFTLKDGSTFASGNPVTADDVVYSYQRVIALKKGPSFLFTDIAGLTDQSFKATDPKTGE